MPKRPCDKDFDYLRKKLKKLEKEISNSRRRSRIIESSSSASSREPSPHQPPQNQQDGMDQDPAPTTTVLTTIDLEANTDSIAPSESKETTDAAPSQLKDLTDASPSEDCCDSILLEILGEDQTTTEEYGQDIHKDLATRFNHLATIGLDSKTRKELTSKYLIPANCTRIAAPLLNAEIKAALPETMIKRDKQLEFRQKHIATAIACLSSVMTDQLNVTSINQDLLKKLMDVARLLCDIQHTDSVTRRNFALFSLKKDMKEHLNNTKIDKFLFGENLPEALKSAKAVNKSSSDLKIQNKIVKKPATHTKTAPKNWKTSVPACREPASHTSSKPPPPPSSRKSSPPPRTNRRR